MKNFDWNEFKESNVAVHCDTLEKAIDFLKQCNDRNMVWSYTNNNLLENNNWNLYNKNTCYEYNQGDNIAYSKIAYFRNEDYKIIEWEDEKEFSDYILDGNYNRLYLKLNQSQINLINLLKEEGLFEECGLMSMDDIEYKIV